MLSLILAWTTIIFLMLLCVFLVLNYYKKFADLENYGFLCATMIPIAFTINAIAIITHYLRQLELETLWDLLLVLAGSLLVIF